MRFERFALPMIAVALLALGACGKDKPGEDEDGDAGNEPLQARIVKSDPGPDVPDAKLNVISPAADEVVTSDSVLVKVQLTGVGLETPTAGEQSHGLAYSKDGQHIHVIIDGKPYMAMYKIDSFSVGALAPGAHTLRAFPSRSWHESIKTPGAFVARTFYYKTKTGDTMLKPGEPLLTYSRPKGEYKGADAKQVLLDFYLSNAQLGPGKFKVIATLDGKLTDTLVEWSPYVIEGLADGEHTMKLVLIGPDGKPVPGAFNNVEGKFKVARKDAPMPAMKMKQTDTGAHMAHDSGAGAPAVKY